VAHAVPKASPGLAQLLGAPHATARVLNPTFCSAGPEVPPFQRKLVRWTLNVVVGEACYPCLWRVFDLARSWVNLLVFSQVTTPVLNVEVVAQNLDAPAHKEALVAAESLVLTETLEVIITDLRWGGLHGRASPSCSTNFATAICHLHAATTNDLELHQLLSVPAQHAVQCQPTGIGELPNSLRGNTIFTGHV